MLGANMVEFTPIELEALARMVSTMLRVDGQASEEERAALATVTERVGSAIQYWLDKAASLPASREDFVRAAGSVTRKEAQQAIYEALYDISASDAVAKQEWDLLKILVDTWNIDD